MPFITDDRVCLLLLQEEEEDDDEGENEECEVWFYLDIPLDDVDPLCLTPRKYLLYLAWCILGLDVDAESLSLGVAGEGGEFHRIGLDGDLEGGGIYTLIAGDSYAELAVVDLEDLKAQTAVPSETTETRQGFRTQLIERDVCCVFTGFEAQLGEALPVIPFERGSEWFRLIIQNRPYDGDDDLRGLNDIADVRNGFFAMCTLHPAFDARRLVILKTPNRFLDTDDIPPSPNRQLLSDDVDYPEGSRYSAQWLVPSHAQRLLPNNTDATFSQYSAAKKPSALLLHYNYGAAAVKLWGRNKHILQSANTAESRPPKPAPTTFRPPCIPPKRGIAIEKRRKALAEEKAKRASASKGAAAWDEDDVMLFFWGNSTAARERYRKTSEAKRETLEQWRQGLPVH